MITKTTNKVNGILSKNFIKQHGYFIQVVPSPCMMIGLTEKGAYIYFNYAGTYHVAKDNSPEDVGCYIKPKYKI